MGTTRLRVFVHFFFTLLSTTAICQIPSRSNVTGTPVPGAGHDYIHEINETVNPANGSLSIRIGVPMPPSRGFTLPFRFAYDSSGVFYLGTGSLDGETPNGPTWTTTKAVLSQGGWSYSAPMVSVQSHTFTGQSLEYPYAPISCTGLIHFVFQDAQGNRHNLGLSYWGPTTRPVGDTTPCAGWDELKTTDGEGPIVATTSSTWNRNTVNAITITDGDGTVYHFPDHGPQPDHYICSGTCTPTTWTPDTITDRNGNTFNIASAPGSQVLSYTDTIGRTALIIPTFGSNPDTVSVSGLAPYSVNWTSVAANYGVGMTLIGGGSCAGAGSGGQPAINAVSTITLPNSKQYAFDYSQNAYGLVDKITYPSGGYVRYQWGLNPQSEYGNW